MEKFTVDADYQEVVKVAKSLNVPYVGKKKPALIELVNAKIEAIANGEVETPAADPVDETHTDDQQDATQTVNKPAAQQRAPRTPATQSTPRSKGPKWYETETPIYNEGDIVDIIAGPCLVGRQAYITRPSSKKDTMKCKLINPKDGTLQGTEITMDYYKLKLNKKANEETIEEKEPQIAEAQEQHETDEATA